MTGEHPNSSKDECVSNDILRQYLRPWYAAHSVTIYRDIKKMALELLEQRVGYATAARFHAEAQTNPVSRTEDSENARARRVSESTPVNREPMTDGEYERRYLVEMIRRLEAHGQPDAADIAQDSYEQMPRGEMDARWQDDPEGAAAESFIEWRDSMRDDDYDETDLADGPYDDSGDWGDSNPGEW